MPKKIIDRVVRDLLRDIQLNYQVGSKYPSIKEVAANLNLSFKTAYKAVKILQENGILRSVRKGGTTVISLSESHNISGKKIILLSRIDAASFNKTFYRGIQKTCAPEGVNSSLVVNDYADTRSTSFGDYLLSLNADGIISIAFEDCALAFCHAMSRGLDIVADIPFDELPYLPVAHTDNYTHGQRAAKIFLEHDYTDILVGMYYDVKDLRYRGFFRNRYEGFSSVIKKEKARTTVIRLSDPNSNNMLDKYFENFSSESAAFSLDNGSNHILASKFYQHGIEVSNDNFLLYDCPESSFSYYGLPPVKIVGPSFEDIGKALARKMIRKWKQGFFDEPLVEKI